MEPARSGRRVADTPLAPATVIPSAKLGAAERLKFARQILCSLLLVCVGVFVGYAALPENAAMANIFEVIKIGALPLVTRRQGVPGSRRRRTAAVRS